MKKANTSMKTKRKTSKLSFSEKRFMAKSFHFDSKGLHFRVTGAISAEWDRNESYVFGEIFTSGSKCIIEMTSLAVTRKAESLMWNILKIKSVQ